ncbi:hypothetical protein GCM10011511_11580 [Puia dinghuensis]|uniref:Uncharacterized protein n=2 Tax=Puia dinghuensis TaxID=1792502 RepID=A0A8J2XRQ7_9BACT|nr:hypothetical protein GCM10011511_11580 [Puia dinghuensis]
MDKLSSNVLLAGCILMANLDWAGIAGYALKAAIGGGIWLAYKLAADRIERTRQKKQ